MLTYKPIWILFDVGGVLLDWHSSSIGVANMLNVNHNVLLKILFRNANDMILGKISSNEGWKKILNKLSKKSEPNKIVNLWRHKKYWPQDTLSLIRELYRAGYKLAILTNSWLNLQRTIHEGNAPNELIYFEHIFDSSKERLIKPGISLLNSVEKRIGAKGKSILLIDDDKKNIAAANKIGWQTFLYSMHSNYGINSNNKIRSMLLKV